MLQLSASTAARNGANVQNLRCLCVHTGGACLLLTAGEREDVGLALQVQPRAALLLQAHDCTAAEPASGAMGDLRDPRGGIFPEPGCANPRLKSKRKLAQRSRFRRGLPKAGSLFFWLF